MSTTGTRTTNKTAWVADSGFFIACGRQENAKYTALEQYATQHGITFIVPRSVYEELGGAPAQSTPGQIPIDSAIQRGWVTVADELDYTDSTRLVSNGYCPTRHCTLLKSA